MVQGADGILISPHSGWGLKCGGCFSPADGKEQISWLQYIDALRKKATNDLQDLISFLSHQDHRNCIQLA